MITALRYAAAMAAGTLIGLAALWSAIALASTAAIDSLATFAGMLFAGAQ